MLSRKRNVDTPITTFGKEMLDSVLKTQSKYKRKLDIERGKYIAALNSSKDLIALREFLRKDPIKNSQLPEAEIIKQASLSGDVSVGQLKNELVAINKGWDATSKRLKDAEKYDIGIIMGTPVKATEKNSLSNILKKVFNLNRKARTSSNTLLSEADAAATIMDRIINTIAKRQGVSPESVYNSTFYKISTPEEISESLQVLEQSIGAKGISNLNIPDSKIYINIDGKPRYELSDSDAILSLDVSPDYLNNLHDRLKKGVRLKDLLFHEKLFKAYPQLANLIVLTKPFKDGNERGMFIRANTNQVPFIVLNEKDLDNTSLSPIKEIMVTLLHEVQHAIQQIEGYDAGLSPMEYKMLLEKDQAATKKLIDYMESAVDSNKSLADVIMTEDDINELNFSLASYSITQPITESDIIKAESHLLKLQEITDRDYAEMYLRTLEEVEARATELRMELTQEEIDSISNRLQFEQNYADSVSGKPNTKIFKDYDDAILSILETKTPQMLFQENSNVIRVYHGTSKDKDFKKFKKTDRGVFVTTSPKEASYYAEENDSIRVDSYNSRTGVFDMKNTSSRVFPMNLTLQNVYKLTKEDINFLNSSSNYSKVQKILHSKLRSQGYDVVDYNNGVYAVLNEGLLNSTITNDILFQLASLRGIQNAGLNNELNKAKSLLLSGKSAEVIKKETGFEKDKSGNWRYEFLDISDISIPEFDKKKKLFWITDFIPKTSEIFKFYPDIQNVVLEIVDKPTLSKLGSYTRKNERIFLNLNKLQTKESILSTLAHEIQHFIQNQEGIAGGSSIKRAGSFEAYRNSIGELEARRVQDRINLTFDEKRNSLFYTVIEEKTSYSIKNIKEKIENIAKQNGENKNTLINGTFSEDKYSPFIVDLFNIYSYLEDSNLVNLTDNNFNDFVDTYMEYATGSEKNSLYKFLFASENIDINFQQAQAAYQASGGYSKGNAKFDILKEFEDIIHALTSPNVSSPIHEMAHKFEKYLTEEEKQEVLKWANSNKWSRDTSEKFARGFEAYLASGEAPSSALKEIFELFKTWLTEIYNGIKGSAIDIELNDSMKTIYAKMLGESYESTVSEQLPLRENTVLDSTHIPDENFSPLQLSTNLREIYNKHFDNGVDADLIFSKMLNENSIVGEEVYEGTYIYYSIEESKTGNPMFKQGSIEYTADMMKERMLRDKERVEASAQEAADMLANYRKQKEASKPSEEVISQPEVIIKIEEEVEEADTPITEINGWEINTDVTINGNPYKIRSFIKVGSRRFVTASPILYTPTTPQGQRGKDTTRTYRFPIEDIRPFQRPTFKNSTLVADDIDESPAASEIVQGSTVMYNGSEWIVNTIKPDGIYILKKVLEESVVPDISIIDMGLTEEEGNEYYIVDDKQNMVVDKSFTKKEDAEKAKDEYLSNLPRPKPVYEIANSSEITFVKEPSKTKNEQVSPEVEQVLPEVEEEKKVVLSEKVLDKVQAIKTVLYRMSEMFPSLKYEVVDYPDQDWAGKFSKGVVYINLNKANVDTPIHEFLHPFVFVLSKENPELYSNLIDRLKTEFSDFYLTELQKVNSTPGYSDLNKEQRDEEVLIRFMTSEIMKTVDKDTGEIIPEEMEKVNEANRGFLDELYRLIFDFIDKILRRVTKKSETTSRAINNISSIEYNSKYGTLKIFGNSATPWVTSQVKTKDGFSFNNFIINAVDSTKGITRESKETLKSFLTELVEYVERENPEENVSIPFRSFNSFNNQKNASDVAQTSLQGYQQQFPLLQPEVLSQFSVNTTLGELSTWLTGMGIFSMSFDKYNEDFQKLSDSYSINSKDELKTFSDNLRKNLLNLQHAFEKRFKTTEVSERLSKKVVGTLFDLKSLADPKFIENTGLVENTLSIVRSGFSAILEAEDIMQNIRTRINYGSIDDYIRELSITLQVEGIPVKITDKNYFGFRLNKGTVEINPDRLKKEGFIPQDMSKYLVGDKSKYENFRRQIQGINDKIISNLKQELTPSEIEELNWDITSLRNFYSVYKVFTKRLLEKYASELDYSNELLPYERALSTLKTREEELEFNMRKLSVEWLFPYFDKLQNEALSEVSETERNEKYLTKEKFAQLLTYSNKDANALDYLFGTIVNSHDPINATVAIIISDVVNRNTNSLGHLVSKTKQLKTDFFESKGIKTREERIEYIKSNYLRRVKVFEPQRDIHGKVMKDDEGKPKMILNERWAYHTEYNMDEFDIAKQKFINSLSKPKLPTIHDSPTTWIEYKKEVQEYHDEITKWEKDNLEKFKNKNFEKLQSDPMFVFLYNTYKSHNDLLGENKLKYGIVQQGRLTENIIREGKKKLFSLKSIFDRLKDKNESAWTKTKGILKSTANSLVTSIDNYSYQQENPDGSIYRPIKTSYLNMLKEDYLNLDLTETIIGFTEDALRFSSLRTIQSNVENLRLIINGYGGIQGRKAPKFDANGNILFNSIIKRPQAKDKMSMRLNKQLNIFIDRVFYGDKQEPVDVRLWTSRKYKENYTLLQKMISENKTPEEIYQATSFYLDDEEGRWKTDVYGNVTMSLNKIANNFAFYTSMNSLAFNVMSTTRNLTIGNFVNFSEGYGNKYYSQKSYLEAGLIYSKHIPQNALDLVSNSKSKLNQILFDYQAIQGEFRDRYNKLTTDKSVLARLFSTDSLFFLQHVAEHQIQGTATLALMLETKVKLKDGTETNLWDAITLDSTGTITKDNIDPASFDETLFIRRLQEMNRSNHGNYSDLHKTVIQRQWYGSLLMTFRKHMYPTLKSRWGKSNIDYSKGTITEGFHRTFFRKIAEDIVEYGLSISNYDTFSKDKTGRGWTKEEIYSFRRGLFETLVGVIGLMLLTLGLSGGEEDDEDDSLVKKWLLATANGLYTDIAVTNPLGLYNPFVNKSEIYQEAKKILNNPVAVQFTFKKLADFFSTLVDEGVSEKTEEKFKKVVPIIRHADAFTNPDEYIDGYLKYQSLVGSGTK
jgi:hypothetical protein